MRSEAVSRGLPKGIRIQGAKPDLQLCTLCCFGTAYPPSDREADALGADPGYFTKSLFYSFLKNNMDIEDIFIKFYHSEIPFLIL